VFRAKNEREKEREGNFLVETRATNEIAKCLRTRGRKFDRKLATSTDLAWSRESGGERFRRFLSLSFSCFGSVKCEFEDESSKKSGREREREEKWNVKLV
jgi:hypothetical protein